MTQIKPLLVRLGVKQTDLAEALDVNKQEVHKWLSGRHDPRARTVAEILRFLNRPEHLEKLGRSEPIRFEDLFEVAT